MVAVTVGAAVAHLTCTLLWPPWSCCCLCCLLQAMRSLPHTSSIRWPDQPYNYLRRTFPELSAAGVLAPAHLRALPLCPQFGADSVCRVALRKHWSCVLQRDPRPWYVAFAPTRQDCFVGVSPAAVLQAYPS